MFAWPVSSCFLALLCSALRCSSSSPDARRVLPAVLPFIRRLGGAVPRNLWLWRVHVRQLQRSGAGHRHSHVRARWVRGNMGRARRVLWVGFAGSYTCLLLPLAHTILLQLTHQPQACPKRRQTRIATWRVLSVMWSRLLSSWRGWWRQRRAPWCAPTRATSCPAAPPHSLQVPL